MRKIILFGLFMGCLNLPAQVILKSQLSPVGITQKSQLWNLSLVNTSVENIRVRIELLMSEVSTNRKILSGISKTLTLPRGLSIITPTNVLPVVYNVLSQGYNLTTNQEGFIPVGNYQVCYNVVQLILDAVVPLAEECEMIEVEPISPPILISPSDNEKLEINHPVFTWLPPSPVFLFNNLLYDFALVEIITTQSPGDAIQKNIPLQFQRNVSSTALQYSLSLPPLDTGKIYAWQITAKSNNYPVAKSDIWTFTLKNEKSIIKENQTDYYVRLKQQPDASYTLCNGILKFAYLNENADKEVAVKISDVTNSKRKIINLDSSTLSVFYGENFKQIDLTDEPGLINKHIYVLEIINSKQESWFLKFEYRKPN
jgi:hypothetical protein